MMPSGLFEDLKLLFYVYRNGFEIYEGSQAQPADTRVAVVMGAQVIKGGRPSPALDARVRHAARLWREGVVELLIPTGGLGGYPPKEADLMAEILLSEGVPREAILPEDAALNTWDSAVRVAEISGENGIGCVRVITDPLPLCSYDLGFRGCGAGRTGEPAYESPMWRNPWSRKGQLVREAVALVWYRVHYGVVYRKRL